MKLLFLILLSGLSGWLLGQTVVISGVVRDSATQESLIGAYVIAQGTEVKTTTDAYGRFQLVLDQPGTVSLSLSYIGYREVRRQFEVTSDTSLQFSLSVGPNSFTAVEISASRNYVVPRTEGAAVRLTAQTIQKLPKLLGEADPLRALQLLPGVQNGAEGSSGLYVRGGSPDQNLILIDDIPIYSPNHLGGFFSIIDAEAINAVTLYKGGFPARYSGRLSSIVDVRLKDGSPDKWSRTFSVGVLSSRFALSGPLIRNKLTVSATARRTNLDLFTQVARIFQSDNTFAAGFYFYDATLKAVYDINPDSRITVSTYVGNDKLFVNQSSQETFEQQEVTQKSTLAKTWGNRAIGVRWYRTRSPRLRTIYSIAYTGYNYQDAFDANLNSDGNMPLARQVENQLSSGVKDLSLRLHHELTGPSTFRFGLSANLPSYNQPRITLRQTETDAAEVFKDSGDQRLRSYQLGGYGEWEPFGQDNPLQLNAGLYTGIYLVNGKGFPTIQPRLSVSYATNERYTFFAHYARMVQPLHLLSNSGGGPPTDLWLPATARVRPGRSDQSSIGVRYTTRRWLVEVESYVKSLRNQVEFLNGASFFAEGTDWQDKVSGNGSGSVLGTELLVKYVAPKFQTWVSYTYSRNRRTFSEINGGRTFPYRYDRPHMLGLVCIWEPKKSFNASMSWTLESGNAITLPSARYEVEVLGQEPANNPFNPPDLFFGPHSAYLYRSRNNARLPTYHRLDLNLDFIKHFRRKGKDRVRTTSIGVYNGYSRQNPYFVFYDSAPGEGRQLQSLTLFPIIPYVSYKSGF